MFIIYKTMSNNYVVAPLIPGDATFSDGVYTDNVEIYGYLQVDGPTTSEGTVSGTQFISTINSGTAPFIVQSSTVVPILYVSRSQVSDTSTSLNGSIAGPLAIIGSIDSSSPVSGLLTVGGGLGVALDTYMGGFLNVGSTINSVNITTGSLIVAGGIAVNNNIWAGGNFHAISNIQTTGPTIGTFQVVGGGGFTQSLSLGTGLLVHEGTNAKQGTANLISGSSTVGNTSVTSNSRIFLTIQSTTQPTNVGALFVAATVPSSNFVVRSTNQQDSSTFAYEIFEVC